jgi:hypothetical protein
VSLAVLPLVALISTSTVASPSPADLDARLAFLEEHLEAPKLHARVWYWGWFSLYSAAIVTQSIRLGLVDGGDPDADAQRADLTIAIVKATAGVISLLVLPLDATDGAEAMRAIEGDTPDDKLRRLAAGEAALAQNAKQSDRRHWWIRHAAVLAINIVGGLIVWIGYDDPERGVIAAALGIAAGELAAWTQPWQPRASMNAYLSRY